MLELESRRLSDWGAMKGEGKLEAWEAWLSCEDRLTEDRDWGSFVVGVGGVSWPGRGRCSGGGGLVVNVA